MESQKLNINSKEARDVARTALSPSGGLPLISRTLAQQLQLPNLRYFGTEKMDDVEKREDWLAGEEFGAARGEMKDKLNMLIEVLESSEDVVTGVTRQKQAIQQLQDKNMTKILDKTRNLEKTWRELDLFYSNAAETELRLLDIANVNTKLVDETQLVNKIQGHFDNVNKKAIDLEKNYSFFVAPGYIGQSLIERFKDVAYKNKLLFLTDFKDEASVDEVVDAANEPGKAKLGGDKTWSRTVLYTNSVLLREKYAQEKRLLYGSPTAAVAGKLYTIDNIAQPIAGAEFGALKGLKGIRFGVNQEQANILDKENLNPLTNAFGKLMPFNVTTMFTGENVELRQYNVVRTLDYVDKIMKHFLNQKVFTSMMDSQNRLNVHRAIVKMLERLAELKILKSGRITHFDIDENSPDRFNIKLDVLPMFVTAAFEYTIAIDDQTSQHKDSNVEKK